MSDSPVADLDLSPISFSLPPPNSPSLSSDTPSSAPSGRAALACGLSNSNPTRSQRRRPPLRSFVPRRSVRDRSRPPSFPGLCVAAVSVPDLAAPARGPSHSTVMRP
ncbi:hypothetical protein EDB86DRAFT_3071246 [Lactarius hatsudake]|nr:hypothetical protein EDB86DRAFT_3071246 [Lactarius hatsudake]